MNNANWRETLMPFPCFQKQNRHSSGCVSHFFLTAEKPRKIKRKKLCDTLRLCGSIVSTAEKPRKIKRKKLCDSLRLCGYKFQNEKQNENECFANLTPHTSPLTPDPFEILYLCRIAITVPITITRQPIHNTLICGNTCAVRISMSRSDELCCCTVSSKPSDF